MMTRFEPWTSGSRIKAIVGHYGSGKTEISLNMAIAARRAGLNATVVDMDIVNPFFRSAEQEDKLKQAGVKLIAPPYALTGVDLPVLTADILSVFERKEDFSVLDVGGNDTGAAALGRFHHQMAACGADLYFVVNPYRPFTAEPEQVIDIMARIEKRSQCRVTGLVNNANLGELTGPEQILKGRELVREVSRRTGVPVVCECGPEAALEAAGQGSAPVFPIERLLMPDWLLET